MQNSQRFKIDPNQVISTSNFTVSISSLTCKICYCVLINPKQCYNKKCAQICCSDCIDNAMPPGQPCPFCKYNSDKMEYAFLSQDTNLIFILKNLKLICKHIECKGKVYTIDAYKLHLSTNNNDESQCNNESHQEDWRTLRKCSQCSLIACKLCENNVLQYSNWEPLCVTCSKNMTNTPLPLENCECNICKKKITKTLDPFSLVKCDICNEIICNKCSARCGICKNFICEKCDIHCDFCTRKYSNSFLCKKCAGNQESMIITTCEGCGAKRCVNCVQTCNACYKPLCEACHTVYKCESCDSVCCSNHNFRCELCSSDNNKFVCMKRCTFTCEICFAKSSALCSEDKHATLSHCVITCPHQICTGCIEKCDKCHVEQCQLCNKGSRLFKCDFCSSVLCFKCSNFCFSCYSTYCEMHQCVECRKEMPLCYSCFIKENKIFCLNCEANLNECEDCLKLLICSNKCYTSYIKKTLKLKSHICPMFYCDDCRGQGSFLEETDRIRKGKQNFIIDNEIEDKVSINCEESCVCLIY